MFSRDVAERACYRVVICYPTSLSLRQSVVVRETILKSLKLSSAYLVFTISSVNCFFIV